MTPPVLSFSKKGRDRAGRSDWGNMLDSYHCVPDGQEKAWIWEGPLRKTSRFRRLQIAVP
jgi:hypothetical protein